jgi:F-type H+-transporting ATPase subunit delta
MPENQFNDRSQDTVFDVDAERLARVYAEAALDAAGGLAEQEALVGEVESIVRDVLHRDRRMAEILASELISEEEKVAMLDRIFGGRAATTTLNLLKVMARHRRLGLVREVAKVARKMWQTRAGRIPVELETAYPLDVALEREILNSFGNMLGTEPVVTQRVNPDLIGGFVVRVGDRVYDGSVRTRLEQLRQSMVNRAVDAIQRGPERFFSKNSQA